MLEFKFISGEIGYRVAEVSRAKIFRDELGYAEISDNFDENAMHFVGYDGIVQVGSCRLIQLDEEYFSVSYLGVMPEYRRQYVGDLMMRALCDKVLSLGGKYIVLESPLEVADFFKFEDFEPMGEEFTVDGKAFIKMKKDVTIVRPCRGCKK